MFVKPWKYDEAHFDTDFTIACLLTNEHISQTALAEDDHVLYLKLLTGWWDREKAKKQTNSESAQRSKEKKKRILVERYGNPNPPPPQP